MRTTCSLTISCSIWWGSAQPRWLQTPPSVDPPWMQTPLNADPLNADPLGKPLDVDPPRQANQGDPPGQTPMDADTPGCRPPPWMQTTPRQTPCLQTTPRQAPTPVNRRYHTHLWKPLRTVMKTRMHSSTMRTALSSGCLGGLHQTHPPGTRHPPEPAPRTRHPPPVVDRMTDRCKHITLPQTSFGGGKNGLSRCR